MLASCAAFVSLVALLASAIQFHFLSCVPHYSQGGAVVSASQCSIERVSIGSHKVEVTNAFGKPLVEYDAPDGVTGRTGTDMIFEGVRVYLLDGRLVNLQCMTRKYSSADGLRVGDTVDKALAIYGIGAVATCAVETSFTYPIPDSKNYLVLHFSKEVLFKIELWCDY